MRSLNRRDFILLGCGAWVASSELLRGSGAAQGSARAEVCVYGGTASGVMAAVAAAREGRDVILVEPSRWLGGMTGGGLSAIDWGRPEAVGGTARTILDDTRNDPAYRRIFGDLVKKHGITVVFEHRLGSVKKDGPRITEIELDFAPPDRTGCPIPFPIKRAAMVVSASVFVDCSYEGDLMAGAGVSHTYGREAASQYRESLGGVEPNMAVYDIDPYVKPGESRSGLLPFLQDVRMAPIGAADRLTMAYGFRWKFTLEADQIPLPVPEDYAPQQFELYRRAFLSRIDLAGRRMRSLGVFERETGHIHGVGAGNLARSLLAPVVFGSSADYPAGDWSTRSRIWKAQQNFMAGMTQFLRTDPSVPKNLRDKALKVGFQPGIFDETGGWPHQLYVREARRMISDYVLTQQDLEGTTEQGDPVGLASYGVDEWPYATYVLDGKVAINGGYYSELYLDSVHRGIYQVPLRAILPRRRECENLIVPVCCSASHIAMTSVRMEPVWMILGESAGVAAAMAVEGRMSVQEVSYPALRQKLLMLGQRLSRPA